MATKVTLFNNYNGYDFEAMKADLKENNPDMEITDSAVWDYISDLESQDWDYVYGMLQSVFGDNMVIAYGKAGTWRGNFEAIKLCDSIEEAIQKVFGDCDNYSVEWDKKSRKIILTGSHHDGTNTFELKVPNERGLDIYHNWDSSTGKYQSLSEFEVTKLIYDKYSHGVKIDW